MTPTASATPESATATATPEATGTSAPTSTEEPAAPPASIPEESIGAFIAQDLTPEVGDNVKLTLVVVESNGAMAVNETCVVQVFSQPGSDASVEALIILTGADGEATTTLFAGSTPGAVEVSAQCGSARPVVIALNVGPASVPASFPGEPIAAFIAGDLTPEAGDNVELTLVVVESNGALAVNETCLVQVFSQPGSAASVEPLVILTGADGEATTTLFAGSTPGAVEVSAQCGNTPASVITLNVAGASVPASAPGSAPASLPGAGAGSVGGPAELVFWPVIMFTFAGALIVAAGFIRRRDPQLQMQVEQSQEAARFVPRMQRRF